jgi:Chromo (CHRromatin Organisation MOdifier) domain
MFDIIARAGSRSFTLQLPDHFQSVLPVFHISMLEPATPNEIPDRVQSPPPPITIEGEPKYENPEILDSKIDLHYKCKLQYLVQWTGYEGTDEESSWISASELDHASESVSDFHTKYPLRPGPLPIS